MLFTPLGGTTSPHQVQLQLYIAAITVAVPIVVPIIITIAITNIAGILLVVPQNDQIWSLLAKLLIILDGILQLYFIF